MKTAIFAGTFDPVTIGHENIIRISSKMFDKLIVAICVNPEKQTLFSVENRLLMLKEVCNKYPNVEVLYHDGLLVNLMKERDCIYNIRGVRNTTDYNYESNMWYINKDLYPELVNIYIPCERGLGFISSTKVREIINNNDDLQGYLPIEVINIIKEINK